MATEMQPLTLHIGTPKTASSSIQEALWLNRDRIRQNNISFCHALGPTNNIDLFLACLHHDEGGFGILESRGICGEQERNKFRNDVVTRLIGIAYPGDLPKEEHRLVASSEHLWFLWSDVHFRNLKMMLDSSQIQLTSIIVYIRPQAQLLYSALSTMVRDGFAVIDVDPEWVKLHEYQYLDYWDRLHRWKAYFPDARISARWFNSCKANIIEDFFDACAIPMAGMLMPPKMNAGLSSFGIAVLAELNNRYLKGLEPNEIGTYLSEVNPRTMVAELVEKHFSGKPRIKHATCIAIEAYYEQSNSRLIEEYFQGLSLSDFSTGNGDTCNTDASMYKEASKSIVDLCLDLIASYN